MNTLKNSRAHHIVSKIIPGLEGNAYTCVLIEPFWAVAYGMIFFYMPLYMKAMGVNEIHMGFINSFGAVLATITSFMAGPITDKLGRKKTTLFFDLISWTAAMTVWALSQNFWYFIIAAGLNAFSKIPSTSWTCLAIEDTPPNKRAVFFGSITIISLASGIFTPVTGFLIDKFGIIISMRGLLVLGCISMTYMFFFRDKHVIETRIGKELMHLHNNISLKEKLLDYFDAMRYIVHNPITAVVLIIMLLTNFQLAFQFFLVIYLKSSLGLTAAFTSLIPGIAAVVNLIIYFIFIPKIIKKSETHNLTFGLALSFIGCGLFLFVTRGSFIILFISTVFTAAGNLIMSTFRDTLWNNVIGESERAKIFSACQGLISIISIPSGIIAGFLFKANPIYPFVASFIIFVAAFIFSLYAIKIKNSTLN